MSAKHDPEVKFLQLLAASRGSMSRYFVHGSLAQPLLLSPAPFTFMAPQQEIMPRNPGPSPTGVEYRQYACFFGGQRDHITQ